MSTPTLAEIQTGGFTSIKKTVAPDTFGAGHKPRVRRTFEVFQRQSDQTYWWVNSTEDDPLDVHILEVEPKIQLERDYDGDSTKYIATTVYHEKG